MAATRRMCGILTAVSLALVLASCGSSTAAQTSPEVVTAVLVNQDKSIARNLEVPVMISDRSDPSTLYLFGVELLTAQCRFYTSTDRGYSWTMGTAPTLTPYTGCGASGSTPLNFRSSITQASDGTLFIAYTGVDPSAGGSRSILFARSTDKGHNWTTVLVDGAPTKASKGYAELDFEPHIAVDPNNAKHVYIDWRRSYPDDAPATAPPTRAWASSSTDGGVSFSAPALMFDRSINFDPPYPVFVSGTLYASWEESFSAPDANSPTPKTKLFFSSSTDGGKSWTDNIIDQGHSSNVDTPVVLYDTTRSRFDVFWDDDRNGSLNVFYSSSSDGKRWSPAARLDDDKGKGRDHLLPAMALAPNGRIDVVWYDYRNDPYPAPSGGNLGMRNDVYMTSSFDGGTTWTSNIRVNNQLIDRLKGTWNNQYFIEVPPAIASNDTWAVAAWSDTRNGDAHSQTQDFYAAPLAFDATAIPAGFAGATVPGYNRTDLIVVGLIAGIAGLLAGAGLALLLGVRAVRRRHA
ncbi:MAG: glycoside hydrolase [Candidatus Dormibacteraeota bacterium]|nr:glycoside hydrolase [Candidatus Dormibacteraeota bacterium]